MLTPHDELVLVGVSLVAGRRLERVAKMMLDRGDAVAELLRAAGANDDEAWRQIRDVCDRRGGNGFNLLDLVVEVGQQELVRSGESRTWNWPAREGREEGRL